MALFLSPEILQTVRQKEERVRESFTGTVHNSLAGQTVADVWGTVDKREWEIRQEKWNIIGKSGI